MPELEVIVIWQKNKKGTGTMPVPFNTAGSLGRFLEADQKPAPGKPTTKAHHQHQLSWLDGAILAKLI